MVILEHEYECAPELLWEIVTDIACLEEVMAGLIKFTGLPDGKIYTGQTIDVQVSLFGVTPNQDYNLHVLLCDDDAMIVRSRETGAGVQRWEHTLQIKATNNGCRLTDQIDIDAGWKTPLFNRWAKYMYGARHKPRLKIIERRQ